MKLPGWYWRAVHRLQNRFMDIRAVLTGACNASTWDGTTYRGGYSHWRCAKQHAHGSYRGGTHHRFHNMIWLDAGPVEFSPLEVQGLAEHVKLVDEATPYWKYAQGRRSTDRRGRQRIRNEYYQREYLRQMQDRV